MPKRGVTDITYMVMIVLVVAFVGLFSSVYGTSISGYMVKGVSPQGNMQVQSQSFKQISGCSDTDTAQKNYKNFPLNKFQFVNLYKTGSVTTPDGKTYPDTCVTRSGNAVSSPYVKEYYCRLLPNGKATVESLEETCKLGCTQGACIT